MLICACHKFRTAGATPDRVHYTRTQSILFCGRYGSNSYHNSIHAADVMLSCHHFVTITGVAQRLTKLQLLALFLGAIIHDFNHPGTSNAHEVKVNLSEPLTE